MSRSYKILKFRIDGRDSVEIFCITKRSDNFVLERGKTVKIRRVS